MKNKLCKHLIIMKMIVALLLMTIVQLQAETLAQTVNIKMRNSSIADVFSEIKKQTGYTVLCKSEIIKQASPVNIDFVDIELGKALHELLSPQGLTFIVTEKSIVVKTPKRQAKDNSPLSSTTSAAIVLQQDIHGQVTDEKGSPLPGVHITVKDKKGATVTDTNGNYQISAERGATLVFSSLSYEKKEIQVSTSNTINVSLRFVEMDLEEVVITGYGTFKKSDYTGSASTIKTERMSDVPAVDFSTMLQGNAPGVQVNSVSGQPGGAADIQIRGMGSINASNKPLFVIDGVPVMSGDISSSSSNNAGFDVMSTLSNGDIEQITVIKDAAAASLYGSRAAGGVILITTKSGKAGKPVFSVKGNYGISSQATDFREVMDGPQRRAMLLEGLRNRARYIDNLSDESEIEKYAQDNIDKYAPEPWNGWADWKKEVFRSSIGWRQQAVVLQLVILYESNRSVLSIRF
jgi:TonB-dependent SusC/RagA subfamily outer membrane receptor